MGAMHGAKTDLLHNNDSGSLPQEGALHNLLPDSLHSYSESALHNMQLHNASLQKTGSVHYLQHDPSSLYEKDTLRNLFMG